MLKNFLIGGSIAQSHGVLSLGNNGIGEENKLQPFGGEPKSKAIFDCPPVEWKSSFHRGGTGYIDGIRNADLDAPVMCGTDPQGRKFIAIKYTCQPTSDRRLPSSYSTDSFAVSTGAIALFQRYAGNSQLWVNGEHGKAPGCPSPVTFFADNPSKASQEFNDLTSNKGLLKKGFHYRLAISEVSNLALPENPKDEL